MDMENEAGGTGENPVSRRLVFIFPGFEPMPVDAHARRFVRESEKTAPIYGMTLAFKARDSASAPAAGVTTASLDAEASGDGWRTATEIVLYGLGDLDGLYSSRPAILRFFSGLWALCDFIVTGTLFRFIRTSWRYGLFFGYPLLISAVLAVISVLAAMQPARWWGEEQLLWSIPLGIAVFVAGIHLANRYAHFLLIMDDWNFARDIARGRRQEIDRRLTLVARDVVERVGQTDADEIVFAAHSFGAVTAVRSLAAVIETQVGREKPCGLLTVGSSLLKIALHPAAASLRAAVGLIVRQRHAWLDVQSLTDPINFYKSSPARDLGITDGRQPLTMRVRFRSQLTAETYGSIRRDFFRTHRQFVYAVERWHPYSFHAILLGPTSLEAVTCRGGLPDTFITPREDVRP
ncbi:MAG TPA: hypothetical protein VMF90_18490 [Rhizobiaceae bacterium]|nr:hypothetical protein [Rhizobiaceae bacterium]